MTIRSGGRPRDTRQAHPIEHETHEEPWQPEQGYTTNYRNGQGNGRNGYGNGNRRRGSGGSGAGGILRFLAFAAILAAVVLIVLITVLRPVISSAVVGWADDNPGALGIDFVADMVKDDLGPKLTTPASDDTTQLPFRIGSGESATTIA
ncbi:MAG TPA: hypothetical protein VFV72_15035, partial [Candidatus Limnocylindrales bacterium]|nr:hypothetical protein [Candidatus Limnocylindrales bacterium]